MKIISLNNNFKLLFNDISDDANIVVLSNESLTFANVYRYFDINEMEKIQQLLNIEEIINGLNILKKLNNIETKLSKLKKCN